MSPETWAALKTIDESGADISKEIFEYDDRVTGKRIRRDIRVFEYGVPFMVGDLKVVAERVDHSAIGSCAFFVETSEGWVSYVGDLRMNDRVEDGELKSFKGWTERYVEIAAKFRKIIALFIEGTNFDKSYTPDTEQSIGVNADELLKKAKGHLTVVDYNFLNVERMKTFLQAAKENGRRLVISTKAARLLDNLQESFFRLHLKHAGFQNLVDIIEKADIESKEIYFGGGPDVAMDGLLAGILKTAPRHVFSILMRAFREQASAGDLAVLAHSLEYSDGMPKITVNIGEEKWENFLDLQNELAPPGRKVFFDWLLENLIRSDKGGALLEEATQKWFPEQKNPLSETAETEIKEALAERLEWMRRTQRAMEALNFSALVDSAQNFKVADYGVPDVASEPHLRVYQVAKNTAQYKSGDYRDYEKSLFSRPGMKFRLITKEIAAATREDILLCLNPAEMSEITSIIPPRETIYAIQSQGEPFNPELERQHETRVQHIQDHTPRGEPLRLYMYHATGHLFPQQIIDLVKKINPLNTFIIHTRRQAALADALLKELGPDRHVIVPLYARTYSLIKNEREFEPLEPALQKQLPPGYRTYVRRLPRSEIAALLQNPEALKTAADVQSDLAQILEAAKKRARIFTSPLQPDSKNADDVEDKLAELRLYYQGQLLRLKVQELSGIASREQLDQTQNEITAIMLEAVRQLASDALVTDFEAEQSAVGPTQTEIRKEVRRLAHLVRENKPLPDTPYGREAGIIVRSYFRRFAQNLDIQLPALADFAKPEPVASTPAVLASEPATEPTAEAPPPDGSLREALQAILNKLANGLFPKKTGEVIFHAPVDEIAGNTIEVRDGGSRLFFDIGFGMSDWEERFASWGAFKIANMVRGALGIKILPWVPSILRRDMRPNGMVFVESQGTKAVFVSHAHTDHIGDLWALDPDVLIICSQETKAALLAMEWQSPGSIRSELTHTKDRTDMSEAKYPRLPRNILTYRPGDTIEIPGTSFKVRTMPVGHSIPAEAFIVETSMGKIVYTGDVTLQSHDGALTKKFFDDLAKEPDILMLLTEGSNVREEKRPNVVRTEAEYIERVDGIIKTANRDVKPVFASFSWNYLNRLITYDGLAKANGRKLVIPLRLAYFARLVHALGYKKLPDVMNDPDILIHVPDRKWPWTMQSFIYQLFGRTLDGIRIYGELPDEKKATSEWIGQHQRELLVVLPLSQLNELDTIHPLPDSPFIYSLGALFNPSMEMLHAKLGHWFKKWELVWEDLYVSPHIAEADLINLLRPIKAKYIVPIHTSNPRRFEKLLPEKRFIFPDVLKGHPLFEQESMERVVDALLPGMPATDRAYLKNLTDAEALDLMQGVPDTKTKEMYGAEIAEVVEVLRSRAVYVGLEDFVQNVRSYYRGEHIRMDWRAELALVPTEALAEERRQLDAAILDVIVPFLRNYYADTDLRQFAAQLDGDELRLVKGPPNPLIDDYRYTMLGRLTAELLYEITGQFGIDPALPLEEKNAWVDARLQSQVFPVETAKTARRKSSPEETVPQNARLDYDAFLQAAHLDVLGDQKPDVLTAMRYIDEAIVPAANRDRLLALLIPLAAGQFRGHQEVAYSEMLKTVQWLQGLYAQEDVEVDAAGARQKLRKLLEDSHSTEPDPILELKRPLLSQGDQQRLGLYMAQKILGQTIAPIKGDPEVRVVLTVPDAPELAEQNFSEALRWAGPDGVVLFDEMDRTGLSVLRAAADGRLSVSRLEGTLAMERFLEKPRYLSVQEQMHMFLRVLAAAHSLGLSPHVQAIPDVQADAKKKKKMASTLHQSKVAMEEAMKRFMDGPFNDSETPMETALFATVNSIDMRNALLEDALGRLRREHPKGRIVVVRSALHSIFTDSQRTLWSPRSRGMVFGPFEALARAEAFGRAVEKGGSRLGLLRALVGRFIERAYEASRDRHYIGETIRRVLNRLGLEEIVELQEYVKEMVLSDSEIERLDKKIYKARTLKSKREHQESKFDRAAGYILDWLRGKHFIADAELSRFPEINFFIDVIKIPLNDDVNSHESVKQSQKLHSAA